jgi:hypothetical protein
MAGSDTHVLHLLDPANCGDEGLLACAAAMRGMADVRHHAWIVGTEADERRCWSLGIITTDRVIPRRCAGPLRDETTTALRRLLAACRTHQSLDPELVQCWSLDALHLARRVFGTGAESPARCAVVARPPEAAQRSTPSDSDLATGREVIAAYDHATRRAVAPLMSGAGEDEAGRWLPTIRMLAAPAFEPGGPVAVDRAAVRRSLGVKPEETIVSLLADPPGAGDAQRMVFAMGVLNAIGHRTVSLVRSGARQDRRAAAYLAAHSRRWGLVLADLSLAEAIGASDVCVVDHVPDEHGIALPTCGPVGASLALAMGVPIVTFPGVLAGWPVLAARSASLGSVSGPIRELLENPRVRVEHAAGVRGWCDRARAAQGFERTLAAIWAEQLNVPSSPQTASYVR